MMNLQRKLRSRTGASMILALLFLMFCSFVGGSVLVSATANAARVGLHNEQQPFLDQRSAALLLSDELQVAEGQRFRLYVLDAYRTISEHEYVQTANQTRPTGRKIEERVITFQLMMDSSAQITGLQKLLVESTIWRYLRNEAVGETVYVIVKDHKGANWKLSDFAFKLPDAAVEESKQQGRYSVQIPADLSAKISGRMQVSAQLVGNVPGLNSLTSYYTYFHSCGIKNASHTHITDGKEGTEIVMPDDLFDFMVDFGEDSQMKLVMDAYSGTSDLVKVVGLATRGKIDLDNPKDYIQVTTESVQTIISWSDPTIEKGGA